MVPFETDNLRAYELLLRIEVALRELVRETYQAEYGDSWQKHIPGDLRKKIKESQNEENQPRFDFLRLGPLYYLTLGEMCQILRQTDGKKAVAVLGGESFVDQSCQVSAVTQWSTPPSWQNAITSCQEVLDRPLRNSVSYRWSNASRP